MNKMRMTVAGLALVSMVALEDVAKAADLQCTVTPVGASGSRSYIFCSDGKVIRHTNGTGANEIEAPSDQQARFMSVGLAALLSGRQMYFSTNTCVGNDCTTSFYKIY